LIDVSADHYGVTTTATLDLNSPDELELVEVETSGPPAAAVLGIAAVSTLVILWVAFGAITGGGVSAVKLLLLALSLGGAFFAGKQIAGAEEGQLLKVKERFAAMNSGTKERQPSVKITGALMDI
jgi:hypothetical protein